MLEHQYHIQRGSLRICFRCAFRIVSRVQAHNCTSKHGVLSTYGVSDAQLLRILMSTAGLCLSYTRCASRTYAQVGCIAAIPPGQPYISVQVHFSKGLARYGECMSGKMSVTRFVEVGWLWHAYGYVQLQSLESGREHVLSCIWTALS